MAKAIAWHLVGFIGFGLLAWLFLTLLLVLPLPAYSWAAWLVAGNWMLRGLLFVALCASVWLAFAWLIDAPDQE